MDLRRVSAALSVAAQISEADLPAVSAAGFRSVICNRPDGEAAEQPRFADMQKAAHQAGLEMRYLPAESGQVTQAQGAAFGRLMEELPGPVLAYCRSGMRSTTLWALSEVRHVPLSEILQTAAKAGFDVSMALR